KVLYVLLTVYLITTLNFFLFQVLPGDPTYFLLPRGGGNAVTGTEDVRLAITRQWGLDQPVMIRYFVYLDNLLHGNLGTSITFRIGTPVVDVIAPRLATTLLLVGLATAATMWLGLILGRISGWRRGRRSDVIITMSSLFGYSMPSFWLSLVLLYTLALVVPIFPVYGLHTIGSESWDP